MSRGRIGTESSLRFREVTSHLICTAGPKDPAGRIGDSDYRGDNFPIWHVQWEPEDGDFLSCFSLDEPLTDFQGLPDILALWCKRGVSFNSWHNSFLFYLDDLGRNMVSGTPSSVSQGWQNCRKNFAWH